VYICLLHKGQGCDRILWVVTIQRTLFLSSLKRILSTNNYVWFHSLTNDTNPAIQKFYSTVCARARARALVCVFVLSTYIGMYRCMNIQDLYIYAHRSFIQSTVQTRCCIIAGAPEEPPAYSQTSTQNQDMNANFTSK
jgi:hypothetical protein